MLYNEPYLPIVVMMIIAALFSGAFLLISSLLQPKKADISDQSAYECGVVHTLQSARERFSVKFFLVAMLFILFDIEAVFMYPWAALFREFVENGHGLFMLSEGLVFVAVLGIGLAYIWKKGALDWK